MVSTLEHKNSLKSEEFNPEAQSSLESFFLSKQADRTWQSIEKAICRGANLDSLELDIAARIFEKIAFKHLNSSLKSEGLILLSPDETQTLYDELYPEWAEVNIYELFNFKVGINTPDGLIFKRSKIRDCYKQTIDHLRLVGVCESTICTDLDNNLQKLAQLERYQRPGQIAADLNLPILPFHFTPSALNYELGALIHKLRPTEIPSLPVCRSSEKNWRVIFAMPQDSICSFLVEKISFPFDCHPFRFTVHKWLNERSEEVFPEGWSCKNLSN